ncbi:flavin monoamine oxidase family protein [Aneurinibacillus sp. REN35]|uniref:flavin monoamine oxidase family protein n=1 Tax=Aneurinibacillus sp. REN35 TaxID=3237286 RepID=UPI0035270616
MARTPLLNRLQAAVSVVKEASSRNVTVEQVLQEKEEAAISRREFLQRAAFATAALAVPPAVWSLGTRMAQAALAPRIAVVGAGLAGLTCAYRLQQAGIRAEVYEASNRIGGRCFSIRNVFDEGQIAEHGGELIDTDHTAILRLVQECGLEVDHLLTAEKPGTEDFYHFFGAPYTFREATAAFTEIWNKLHNDVTHAGYPTTYKKHTPRGLQLDQMAITDWINETVSGGTLSPFGKLLDIAYTIEYGAEASEQSALNLLYLLGYSEKKTFQIFGPSDEAYHVRGGNDQIVTHLAESLAGQIHMQHALTAIQKNMDDTYTLLFEGGGVHEVIADYVVLALPFSILREIDYRQAGFKGLKETAIKELGMGTNSKFALQFKDRHWEALGCNGATYADTGYQNTWEVSRAQPGTSGILVNFTGGAVGSSFSQGSTTSHAAEFLRGIEPVLPGLGTKWNGKATIDYWPGYRWTKGSYAYYKVGQYTRFAGVEGEVEGRCYFAGDHASLDFQGYMNGAVETGEAVAKALAKSVKAKVLV